MHVSPGVGKGESSRPQNSKRTYVFVAVCAGQVQRSVAVVVLHLGVGFVVQQQQLPKEREKRGNECQQAWQRRCASLGEGPGVPGGGAGGVAGLHFQPYLLTL